MGIAVGKAPGTVTTDQHGGETHPYMAMNGIILEQHSPEFRDRARQIIMFSASAVLLALAEIESVYNENIEEEV